MMKPGVTTPNVFKKQGLVVIALSLVGLLGAVLIAGLFKYNDTIEIPLIKARFQLRGELDADPRIRIVQIDDNSISALQELGVSYPFPRELQGKILRSLTDSGARYVCFDLLFDMNSMHGQEDDEAFRDAILYARSKGTEVILASALPESKSGVYSQLTFLEPNRTLMAADPILGLANTSTISVEKGKGSYRDRERAIIEYQDAVYYSQATQMFRLLLESEGRAFIPAEHGIDENGFMYVNYFGGRSKRIKSVQYVKLFPEVLSGINPLTGESAENADDEWEEGETAKRLEMNTEGTFVDSGDFEGTFVFVGSFSEADNDYFSTPFTDKMFGVETNASAFQTFLSGKHIRLIPIWATIVSLIIFSLIAGHLAYYMPSKFAPFAGIIALAIITAFIFMGFVWWQLLMNCTYTVFTIALSFGSTLAYKVVTEEREKAKIRRTFGRYVSEAVVNEIISNPKLALLGGEDRIVAVLFSDIRNFSTISENMKPEDVLAFLNEFFESTSHIIDAHGGYVDKFMGDGIMAVFGAPVPAENPALDSVMCALAMIKNLREKVHPRMREIGVPEFEIGIGIHHGHVIMGNIGSVRRTDYSIIGDAVNLASRLEATTKEYKKAVIISEDAFEIVKNDIPCHHLATVKVKGRERAESIYWVEHPEIPGLTDLKLGKPLDENKQKQ